MTQTITLYGVPSPNVVKVAMLLEELALPYELVYVDVFKGDSQTPEFLAMNPLGKVPVLADPRLPEPLYESGAILFWLAEREHRFLPPSGPARYEVIEWLMVQMANIGPMLGQYTHFVNLPKGSEPYATARYGALARRLYGLIDQRLGGREWLAGGECSIADFATLPWAEYIDRHGIDPKPFPALQAWRERMNARPGVAAAKARIYGEFGTRSGQSMAGATPEQLDRFFGRDETVPAQDYSGFTRLR